MGIGKRVAWNTGFIFISNIASKIFSVFFIAYAARVLGPSDFGLYALIGTFLFFFSYFGNLGIGPMAIREIARDRGKAKEIFNHVVSLRLALMAISYPLLVAVIYLLGYRDDIKYLILISGFSSIFSVFSSSFGILYSAFERFAFPSIVSTLVGFLTTIANIIVLYLGYGLLGIVLVSLAGNIAGAAMSGLWVRRRFFKYKLVFNMSIWKSLLAQSMPFAVISFFQQANSYANILFLSKIPGILPGETAIGYFKPAASVCQTAMMLPISLRRVTLPTIASNEGNTKLVEGLTNRLTNILLIVIVLPLILLTTFFPREIISVVFGSAYLPAAPALTILGWAYALQVYNVPVSVMLSASKEINRFIPWAGLQLCINLVFAIPLIYYYSFSGAAIAFLASKVFETILRNYLLQTVLGVRGWVIRENIKVLVPMVITFAAILLVSLNSISPVVLFVLTLMLYSICVIYLKDFRQGVVAFIGGFKGKNLSIMERMSGKK